MIFSLLGIQISTGEKKSISFLDLQDASTTGTVRRSRPLRERLCAAQSAEIPAFNGGQVQFEDGKKASAGTM